MSASSVAAPTIIPLSQQRFTSTEGKGRKSIIKSDVPIELSSDTANSSIYYTVNGDKPEPFSVAGNSRGRNKSTIRYTKPFTLSAGKHTIRAVALKDNGVTSSVVTREFLVEQAPPKEEVSARTHVDEEEEGESSEDNDCSIEESPPEGLAEDRSGHTQHPLHGPLQLTAGLWSRAETLTGGDRICLRCSYQFRGGPGIHYCPRCSYPVPPVPTSLLEPRPPQSFCPQCHAVMQKGLSSCPSCHTPMEGLDKVTRIIAQYNQRIEDGVTCDYCGTVNQRDSHLCVTCERIVTPLQQCPQTQPVYPLMFCGAEESCVMCSACGRVNAKDARFCDWCGVQPKRTIMDVVCHVCSMVNDWQARFCSSCKLLMEPSIRPSHVEHSSRWKVTDSPDGCVWYPVVEVEDEVLTPEVEPPVPTAEQGTQTHGFFKSARSMAILESVAQQQSVVTGQHPAAALVAAYSPGRGFWRQQVDHVAHHLRTHTANCEKFQQTFGKLQMGKLSSAAISATEGAEQATLTLTFQLKDKTEISKDNGFKKPALLSLNNKTTNSLRMGNIAQLAMTANKARKTFSKPTQLSAESFLLVKELSASGKGRADIVRQLIEEGASVNTTSDQGDPLVCLAAGSGHCEALKVLIDYGADLTQLSKNGGGALHAAVLRGNGNISCVELLLKSGCNPKVVNRAGLTAAQAAQEKGYSQLSSLLTAHVGSAMLKSLLK